MSFKDFFIKSDTPPPDKKITTVKPTTGPSGSGVSMMGATSAGVHTVPQLDQNSTSEFNKYLMKLMDDANLPGPDYYEFAKALQALAAVPLTEQQKYMSVFAGFQAQGVTAESLVDAAGKYIAILGQKKSSEFDASVSTAAQSIKNMESAIERLRLENEELTNKLSANAQQMAKLNGDVIANKGKLEIKKTTFEVSYKNFIEKIMQDRENIQKYLINGTTTQ